MYQSKRQEARVIKSRLWVLVKIRESLSTSPPCALRPYVSHNFGRFGTLPSSSAANSFMSRSARSFRHGLQELADHRVSIMPDGAEMEAVTRMINYEKLPIVY